MPAKARLKNRIEWTVVHVRRSIFKVRILTSRLLINAFGCDIRTRIVCRLALLMQEQMLYKVLQDVYPSTMTEAAWISHPPAKYRSEDDRA